MRGNWGTWRKPIQTQAEDVKKKILTQYPELRIEPEKCEKATLLTAQVKLTNKPIIFGIILFFTPLIIH